jgi:predicted lipid-binding transport protein (Tim44 family)
MTMKGFTLAILAVFAAVTIGMSDAEARRMGGGMSLGKQAPVQRQATPPQQQPPAAAPRQQNAPQNTAAARPGQPAAAAAAGGSRWMAPLAGIAAGLGLAALATWLGFGEGLATVMLMVLLAFAALVVVRMVMARRAGAQPQPAYAAGGRSEFRGDGRGSPAPRYPQPVPAPASDRHAAPDALLANAETVQPGLTVPADFDTAGFLHRAKVYFVRMQAAFDSGNTDDLREFTTPEMFAELKLQIDQRGGEPGQTDVVTLDAELLGVQEDAREYLASVRFSGLLRELAIPGANPFEEVWNFSKPAAGKGGWVLAGIQQLPGH